MKSYWRVDFIARECRYFQIYSLFPFFPGSPLLVIGMDYASMCAAGRKSVVGFEDGPGSHSSLITLSSKLSRKKCKSSADLSVGRNLLRAVSCTMCSGCCNLCNHIQFPFNRETASLILIRSGPESTARTLRRRMQIGSRKTIYYYVHSEQNFHSFITTLFNAPIAGAYVYATLLYFHSRFNSGSESNI